MTGFTNAGFETGDFTGWSTGVGGSGELLYVQSATKNEGTYAMAAVLSSDGYPVSQGFTLSQNIDFTDIDSMTFDISIPTFNGGGKYCYVKVSIGETTYATYTDVTSGFETATIDTSGISGAQDFMVVAVCPVPDW
jgi:hypothetical protein